VNICKIMQLYIINSQLKILLTDVMGFIVSAVIQHLIDNTEFEIYGVENREIAIIKESIKKTTKEPQIV